MGNSSTSICFVPVEHRHVLGIVYGYGELSLVYKKKRNTRPTETAVLQENFMKLGPKVTPVNATVDGNNNTLLHISIMKQSQEVFDYILGMKNVDVNTVNKHGSSALHFAAKQESSHFALRLIEKGANVNLQNNFEETPLHIACQYNNPELICVLLCHGADPLKTSNKLLPFSIFQINNPRQSYMHEILFNYTFEGEKFVVELKSIIPFLKFSCNFDRIIDKIKRVTYDLIDLEDFSFMLPEVKSEYFKLFINTFNYVICDLVNNTCMFNNYLKLIEGLSQSRGTNFVDFVFLLLESEHAASIVHESCPSVSTISTLVKIFQHRNLPLKVLTNLVCLILTFGVTVSLDELTAVYVVYDDCELFRFLLHMEIKCTKRIKLCCPVYNSQVSLKSIMPLLLCDIGFNVTKILNHPQIYLCMDSYRLLDYFANPKVVNFLSSHDFVDEKVLVKVKKLPEVPLLIELARDAARQHIIEHYKIKAPWQLYTILNWLPINNFYKKIIAFDKKLY